MNKKFLVFSLILVFSLFFATNCFALNILTDLNNTIDNSTNVVTNDISDNTNNAVTDNTIYTPSDNTNSNEVEEDSYIDEAPITTTTTEYEDSGELSITNMINIIFIVVGVVLILLGIAIIIRLTQN